ncbi:acyl-coenzyme A synthetase ACSM3, mitochondrial [Bufo bufo]|uniref:acyl-coenzyme A synthetase ACSM3, mitochondrial n=1 Tax=Bufo bufo TaxID=8384 RepID=UPI001ABE9F0C|nr:acyl-coenzyme A synthetase ACSM3, mitochondrial [Bufo bufo]
MTFLKRLCKTRIGKWDLTSVGSETFTRQTGPDVSAMKILLKAKHLTAHINTRVCCRLFSKGQKFYAPQNFSDYEDVKKSYKLELPEYFNFASDILDKWTAAEKDGSRNPNPALWWIDGQGKEVKWSFDELGFHSRKVANILSDACDLKPGDRVIVILPRVPEWWLFNVACIRSGLVLIPGTIQLTAKDMLHRLQTSEARCIITSHELAPAVDAISAQTPLLKTKMTVSGTREGWLSFQELYRVANDQHTCVRTRSTDPMTIFFTSGTTGSPKMTEHSHCSYGLGLTINGRYWLDLTPSDVFWNTSDTGWAKSAWSSVFAPWIQGTCVFAHYMPRFDPSVILETLKNYPVSVFCAAPTVYRILVLCNLAGYRFPSLQHCVSAGEPINPQVIEQWKAGTGLYIYEGYGQTETVLVCGTFKGMKIKPGSMGKASPAYDVQVIDADGNVLPPDQEGDIGIRIAPQKPYYLFSQYMGDPEKTASTLRGDFYLTGDRGIKDEDDYFWFVGRSDDVILTSGYRIGPFEIESALIEHPAVAESAVVSSPDAIRGEVVKAFIVLSPTYAAHDQETLTKELQEHVKKVTAPYKYPRKIEFVQHLPKTVSGKIRRNELRNKEWGKA